VGSTFVARSGFEYVGSTFSGKYSGNFQAAIKKSEQDVVGQAFLFHVGVPRDVLPP